MIKHLVMWQLMPEAGGQSKAINAREIKQQLESLKSLIPEILSLEVGINCPEVPGNFDVVLNSSFADLAALKRYQEHPEHLKLASFISAVRSSRAAVDYEV